MKWFKRGLYIFLIFVIITSIFFVQLCSVSGSSMSPTIQDGDMLIINKTASKFNRMDIVAIRVNRKLMVKRIIGLPGEKIKIEKGKVFINGKEIEDVVDCETEPGIAENTITLGENEFFVLGDNRGNSQDSRNENVGVIKKKNIVGKSLCYFSFF